jgi:hypothetical protein
MAVPPIPVCCTLFCCFFCVSRPPLQLYSTLIYYYSLHIHLVIKSRFGSHQGRRNRGGWGTGGTCPPPKLFQGTKSALFCDEKCPFLWWKVSFFVMKSALFVQANVAVNTKLTSKVPCLFGNFQVFLKNLVKNVQFQHAGKLFSSPPPSPTFPGKHF